MKPFVWISLLHAVVVSIAEIARNQGGWQWWPFWTIDFVAAALLFAGGLALARRRTLPGALVLTAGWGFSTAMNWMSFASQLEANLRDDASVEPIAYAAGYGVFRSAICLVLSVILLRPPQSD